MNDKQRKAMFAKGQYVHWKGWGLAKVVDHRINGLTNEVEYRVNTKTYKGDPFHFGIKTAHPHELTSVSNEDAMKHIKKIKEQRSQKVIGR